MRYLMTLIFCFPLLSPQVHACFIGTGETIFFDGSPYIQPPEPGVAAIVSTLEKKGSNGGATVTQTAKVVQILSSSDARVKEGDIVAMRYENSSCISGPNGRKGMIVAKTGTDSKGNVVLHLFTNHNAPAMLPEGFTIRPRPIQAGAEIPQGFAVILVGLAGETPIDSLMFDHSKNSRNRYSMHTNFPQRTNSIVAIAVPIGIEKVSVSGIGVRHWDNGKPSYTTIQNVPAKKIDIDRPGLYYTATLDTDNPGSFHERPSADQLAQFRGEYGSTVGKLEAVNFKWPSQ
jgi:hypothetical protein